MIDFFLTYLAIFCNTVALYLDTSTFLDNPSPFIVITQVEVVTYLP